MKYHEITSKNYLQKKLKRYHAISMAEPFLQALKGFKEIVNVECLDKAKSKTEWISNITVLISSSHKNFLADKISHLELVRDTLVARSSHLILMLHNGVCVDLHMVETSDWQIALDGIENNVFNLNAILKIAKAKNVDVQTVVKNLVYDQLSLFP